MLAWHTTSPSSLTNSRKNAVLARLTNAQILAKTTRGSTPGLVDPNMGASSRSIPLPVSRRGQGKARPARRVVTSESEETSEDEDEEQEDDEVEEEGHAEDDVEEGADEVSETVGEASADSESWEEADDGAHEDNEAKSDNANLGDATSEADADGESYEVSNAGGDSSAGNSEELLHGEVANTPITNAYNEEAFPGAMSALAQSLNSGAAFLLCTESSSGIDEEFFEYLMSNNTLMQAPNQALLVDDVVGTSTASTNNDLQYAVRCFQVPLRLRCSDRVAIDQRHHTWHLQCSHNNRFCRSHSKLRHV